LQGIENKSEDLCYQNYDPDKMPWVDGPQLSQKTHNHDIPL
jgi:hypothetical protein